MHANCAISVVAWFAADPAVQDVSRLAAGPPVNPALTVALAAPAMPLSAIAVLASFHGLEPSALFVQTAVTGELCALWRMHANCAISVVAWFLADPAVQDVSRLVAGPPVNPASTVALAAPAMPLPSIAAFRAVSCVVLSKFASASSILAAAALTFLASRAILTSFT
ncbi:uncharacterized protein TEOVI_000518400 [Trypanosoma equiperdum]|uniref:Uncharacterized protein n=1 Tax=Trypanosoma equiperdum TaxID=5694 RepID=A0A1G4I9U3_TRYEQ|nr:hypothetical protein TEOVI_000518400 [Trypanosoma equiperdum]